MGRDRSQARLSLRLRVAGALMRPLVRAVMSRAQDPRTMRRHLKITARWFFRTPKGARFEETEFAGRRALWVSCGAARDDRVLLYLHGGGYLAGSPDTHKKLVARLCQMAGMRAFLPSYRLAPHHPVPAGLDDARNAWAHLRAQGYAADQIILGGDSAGGGMALALLSELCISGDRPAGVFAWSPFTDQTFSGASVKENGQRDHFFPGDRVQELAAMILGDTEPDDPRASPLFADFRECPPVFLQVASSEILRDDALRMEAKLNALGAQVRLELWPEAPHVWQIFDGWFPEAREAIGATADFIGSLSRPADGS